MTKTISINQPDEAKPVDAPVPVDAPTQTDETAQVDAPAPVDETAPPDEALKAEPEVSKDAADELTKGPASASTLDVRDLTPSNWDIQPIEEGITAYNSHTGRRFEGSIADFNAILRG